MSVLTELVSPDGLAGQISGSLGDLAGPFLQCTDKLQLLKQPPGSLSDLTLSLNQLDLSDFGINASFTAHFDSLGSVLPHDLSSLTGSLEDGIGQLTGRLNQDVARVIQGLTTTLSAINAVMDMDFTCAASGAGGETASDGSGSSGSGTGGAGSGGAAGSGSAEGHIQVVAQGAEQVERLEAMLDMLPDPFSIPSLLELLGRAGDIRAASPLISGNIPFLDDVLDTAATLAEWKNATPAELLDHLCSSAEQVDTLIKNAVQAQLDSLASEISALLPAIDPAALKSASETITAELQTAAAAVRAGDIGSVDMSALNAAIDSFNALHAAVSADSLNRMEETCAGIGTLPHRLEDELTHLLSVLRPNIPVGELAGLFTETGLLHPERETGPGSPVAQEITEAFQPLKEWLEALLDILDPSAITEPLQQVSSEVQEAVSGLEQNLAGVTAQIRSLFSEFEEMLDQVDVAAIQEEITDAIHDIGTRITDLIQSITGPLSQAVEEAVNAIGTELDKFSPEAVTEAIGQAINSLTDVLGGVQDALAGIKNGLEKIKKALEDLSFSPVTDQVVEGLDGIAHALQSIDASKLNDLLKAALETALKILPDSLEPVTDPLIDEFDKMIEQGPVPILEKAAEEPKRVFDAIRGFSPSDLVGNTLDAPYNSLLNEMEAYRPSKLLDPLQEELDSLGRRIRETADPAKALDRLSGPWDQLNSRIDALKPSELTEPLNRMLQDGIKEVTDLIPTDEIFSVLDRILDPLQELDTLNQKIQSLADRIDAIGTALENPESEIEAWLGSILDKIPALPDTTALDQKLSELGATIQGLSAAPLREALETATSGLQTMLTSLEPGACLSAMSQTYAGFPRDALSGLPDTPARQAILNALQRFDPMDPQWNALLRITAQCEQNLHAALSWFQDHAEAWNSRYLGEDSPLAALSVQGLSASTLRQWIQEELEASFLRLFNVLLQYLSAYIRPAAMVLKELAALTQPVTGRLSALTGGVLDGIRDSVDNLLSAVRNFNLDFLTDAVDQVFEQTKSKLEILNPATLSQPLETEFNSLLDSLKLESILGSSTIEAVDHDYNTLLEKLRNLAPSKLVEDTVEATYREEVLPVIDQIDFTPVLDAVIECLRSLDDELREEMERVNQSFANLKHAVPSGVSVGSSVSASASAGA